MANTKKGFVSLGIYLSETNPKTKTNKVATIETLCLATAVTAYNAAADDAARAATLIGVWILTVDNLTLGNLHSIDVGFRYVTTDVPPAADEFALAKDKFLISSRDTVTQDAVKISIPARNDSAIAIESDGTTITITAPDMSDFVTAYEAIALSGDLNAVSVIRALISQ
jgi:hypothetical protein